jgi:hypothetical protein
MWREHRLVALTGFSPVLRSMMRPPISGVTFNERGGAMVTIEVVVTNQDVSANPNPAKVDRGELVIWNFQPSSRTFRVVFKKFQPPGGSLKDISDKGPFSRSLSRTPGLVRGNIAQGAQDGLYIYDIQNSRGKKLNWLNPLSQDQNFGGLDVPKPPPKNPSPSEPPPK